MFRYLVVGVVLMCSGCAQRFWYREGATADETRRDLAEVRYEAAKATGNSYTTDIYSQMATQSRQDNIIHAGMEAKGYRLVTQQEVGTLPH